MAHCPLQGNPRKTNVMPDWKRAPFGHKKTGRLTASGQWRADSGHEARLASLFESLLLPTTSTWALETGPGLGLFVVDRVDEALPVLLVYKLVEQMGHGLASSGLWSLLSKQTLTLAANRLSGRSPA